MKNIEKIRKKSAHELATLLVDSGMACRFCYYWDKLRPEECEALNICTDGVEKWLNEEAGDE